jgi:hypothetical protein
MKVCYEFEKDFVFFLKKNKTKTKKKKWKKDILLFFILLVNKYYSLKSVSTVYSPNQNHYFSKAIGEGVFL